MNPWPRCIASCSHLLAPAQHPRRPIPTRWSGLPTRASVVHTAGAGAGSRARPPGAVRRRDKGALVLTAGRPWCRRGGPGLGGQACGSSCGERSPRLVAGLQRRGCRAAERRPTAPISFPPQKPINRTLADYERVGVRRLRLLLTCLPSAVVCPACRHPNDGQQRLPTPRAYRNDWLPPTLPDTLPLPSPSPAGAQVWPAGAAALLTLSVLPGRAVQRSWHSSTSKHSSIGTGLRQVWRGNLMHTTTKSLSLHLPTGVACKPEARHLPAGGRCRRRRRSRGRRGRRRPSGAGGPPAGGVPGCAEVGQWMLALAAVAQWRRCGGGVLSRMMPLNRCSLLSHDHTG